MPEEQCKYLKCVFTDVVPSVGLNVCSCTVANAGSLSSSPKAESCCWTSTVHDETRFVFYPILARSRSKHRFYKHPFSMLAN